ncbi:hypothetical protein CFP56_040333 [Quercus suber]|uniref:Uncharacterized protein n=1 Tax=Quercus suber TaxID=58331 RepID=A0AAW0LM89_QUESU
MGLLTFFMCITLTFLGFAYTYAFILLIPGQTYFYYSYFYKRTFILPNSVLLSLMAVVGIVLLIRKFILQFAFSPGWLSRYESSPYTCKDANN